MEKMKAVLCTRYGNPDVLKIGEVPKPIPKQDEILIRIHNSAVTASDTIIRRLEVPGGHSFPIRGFMRLAMRVFIGLRKPRNPILGLVFSGEVVRVGEKGKNFVPGDKVFGFTGWSRGTYAEYKSISNKEIEAGEVCLCPNNASHEEAAAIAYGGVLALHFLSRTQIKPRQKVLIYGASGAIGTMVLQLAIHLKAQVTAICSPENFDMVTSLGASRVLSYKEESTVDKLDKYDLVLDAVGKNKTSYVKNSVKESLTPSGRYLSVDDGLLKIHADYLRKLKTHFELGHIKAIIDRKYSINEIVDAHKYVDKGHKKGNVIIEINCE